MNISTDSWHYKQLTSLRYKPPRTLCAYFWSLMLVLTLKGILIGLLLVGAVLAGFLLFYIPGWALVTMTFSEGLYMSGASWVVAFFVARKYWLDHTDAGKAYRAKKAGAKEQAMPEQEPNILVEYLRAVKNKVCPIVTYK